MSPSAERVRRSSIGKSSRVVGPEAVLLLQVCRDPGGSEAAYLECWTAEGYSARAPRALAHDNNWRLIQMTKRSYVDVLLKILELIEGFPRGLRMCYIGLVVMT